MGRSTRICYIAYPTSLTLQSANAIQTWTTLRELKRLRPDTLALVPRWLAQPSCFGEVGAVHLPRPAVGKLSRFYRTTLLYYLEHSLFAWMCCLYLLGLRLRGRRYDVAYIRQSVCAAWFAGLLGRIVQASVIYEAHDWETRNPSRAKERWAVGFLHLLDRVALTRSDAVVSLTEHFLRELALLDWRIPHGAVIPDAFDPTIFQPRDRADARRRLGLDAESLLLVYAGMTFAHRGLDRLVSAFAQSDAPNARLLLVGGRPQEIVGLKEVARSTGVADRVVFIAPQKPEVVADYLAAADILAIPDTITDVTASPLKLFEYMAMGRPIIAVDLPALREVVDERAALFVARGDTAALCQAIGALCQEAARRARMGIEAQAQSVPWTYTARAERIVDICDTVAVHMRSGEQESGASSPT